MSGDPSSLALAVVARRIEELPQLDPVVRALDATVPDGLRRGAGRRLMSGSWLGHSLHPLLTDLPIGFWASASLLDLTAGENGAASRRLVGLGILASVPTIAAGYSDWVHLDRAVQRVGVVHAACNAVALACYGASYVRRRKDPTLGRRLGAAGAAALLAGGFFGADLSLTRAVTRDNQLLPVP